VHPCGIVLVGYQKMRILSLRFLFLCFFGGKFNVIILFRLDKKRGAGGRASTVRFCPVIVRNFAWTCFLFAAPSTRSLSSSISLAQRHFLFVPTLPHMPHPHLHTCFMSSRNRLQPPPADAFFYLPIFHGAY